MVAEKTLELKKKVSGVSSLLFPRVASKVCPAKATVHDGDTELHAAQVLISVGFRLTVQNNAHRLCTVGKS